MEVGAQFADEFREEVAVEGLLHAPSDLGYVYEETCEVKHCYFGPVIIQGQKVQQNLQKMRLLLLMEIDQIILGLVPLVTQERVQRIQ